jgi:hypothetical protein
MFVHKGDPKKNKKKKKPIWPMRLLGWKALNCFEEFYFLLKLHWVVLYFTLL